MQIEWGKLLRGRSLSSSTRWWRSAGVVGLVVAVTSLAATGCHGTVEPEANPVALGVPPKVSQKVDNAQAAFVNSLRTLSTSYDEAVCEEEGQMAQAGHERQALAEANLEVAQAVVSAREQVRSNQGGGPPREDAGIIMIEEAPDKKRDRGGWSCLRASQNLACASATASDVAREVYRNHIEGYGLNPVTAADVLEAFAADAAWADQYLVAASDKADAYAQIRQACRDGDSPLARFFRAAADFDQPQVRRDLLMLRDDFVGVQQNVCEALPLYYENVMTELQSGLSRRTRLNRCAVPQWEVLWEQ